MKPIGGRGAQNREGTTASVVQLKARLSEYLRRVKAGNELIELGNLLFPLRVLAFNL